jgi:hypothetical protein
MTASPGPEPIAEGGVLLHIGPYKTGTTAIQRSLHQHRADLAAHGVVYPGATPRQRRASWAAVGRSPRGAQPVGMAAWRRMLAEVERSDTQRVVVSSEDFTSAPPEAVRAIVEDLGPERVHVLMVMRPLEKLFPSSWQQRVKSARETLTFDEWLREVLAVDETWRARAFWKNQGAAQLVEKYAAMVPRERITIVVSDESDRTQQMRTFESLLALPTGLLTPGDHQNTSLSFDRTELLRLVNVLGVERGWNEQTRRALIHGGMLADLRRQPARPGERPIPGLPEWAVDRVAELNRERAELVRASGCRIVGDPDHLAVPPRAGDPAPPPDQVSLSLAAACVAGVVDAVGRREEKQRKAAQRRPPGPANPARTQPRGLAGTGSRELARELGRRVRSRLRRR